MYRAEPQLQFKMQEVFVLDVINPNTTELQWKCGKNKEKKDNLSTCWLSKEN